MAFDLGYGRQDVILPDSSSHLMGITDAFQCFVMMSFFRFISRFVLYRMTYFSLLHSFITPSRRHSFSSFSRFLTSKTTTTTTATRTTTTTTITTTTTNHQRPPPATKTNKETNEQRNKETNQKRNKYTNTSKTNKEPNKPTQNRTHTKQTMTSKLTGPRHKKPMHNLIHS